MPSLSTVNPEYILFAFLASALIAGIASIANSWISARQSYRNELLKLAITTAHQDFEQSQKIAMEKQENTYPMSAYITFHYTYLNMLERGKSPKSALRKALRNTAELMPEYAKSMFSDYTTKWKIDTKWKVDSSD
jgi:hypothetical protein